MSRLEELKKKNDGTKYESRLEKLKKQSGSVSSDGSDLTAFINDYESFMKSGYDKKTASDLGSRLTDLRVQYNLNRTDLSDNEKELDSYLNKIKYSIVDYGNNSKEGASGWQKYLDDTEASKQAAIEEKEDEKWWEKIGRYLSGGTPDTSLPMGTTSQVINDLRQDDSYKKPTEEWTEEQRNAFGKLYLSNPNEAFQYAEKTNNSINKAKEEEKIKDIQDSATSGFGAGLAHTAGAIATAPLGLADFLNDLVLANAGVSNTQYDGSVSPFEYSQAVTGGISEHLNEKGGTLNENIPIIGGKGWGDVYGLGTSIAQSAISGYTMGGLGTLVSYFGQGAASGVDDALSRGASEEQAVLYGTILGVAEGLAEQIGIDNLFKLGASPTKRVLIKNILKQAGAEGLEEGLTSLISNIADNAIMQDQSNFNAMVKAYMEQGMTEDKAKLKAWRDSWEGIAFDALGGFVSGGVHAGVHTGVKSAIDNHDASKTYGDSVESLLAEAVDIGGEAAKVGEKYIEKYGKQGYLSGASLNEIIYTNEQELRTQDKSKIKSAVEAKLTEHGETGDVSTIADILVKQTLGEKLTSKEKNILDKSKAGQQIADELNKKKLKSGEIANDWAADIGTERINADVYNRDLYDLATQKATKQGLNGKDSSVKVSTEMERPIESKFKASESGKTTVDGNEVSIKDIASINDGDITLHLENGETVNANDVEFSSSDAILYATVLDMNLNAETANAFIRGFNATEGLTAEQYALGFREAYKYGSYGFPVQEMSRDGFSSALNESQKSLAYGLGKVDAKYTIEAKQNAVKNAKVTNEFHDDSMSIEEAETVAGLTDRQKTSIKAMKSLSKSLGLKVRFFESAVDSKGKRVGENGRYDPATGIIYIDLYAGLNGEGTILFTAAHELTHHIRMWSPAKFKVFADFLLENYGKKGVSIDALVRAQIEKATRKGRDISYDTAYEEVIADSCEAMLADGDAIAKIAKLKAKDKSLWKKIKDFITNLVAKIKEAYTGLKPDSVEGRLVGKMLDVTEQLKALWTEALVDASANYEASKGGKETIKSSNKDSSDGQALFSVREEYVSEIDEWSKDGMPDGETFVLGTTGDILQGLGAVENDVYLQGYKIKDILSDHPEMTLDEIKKIPKILENPILILKSRNVGRNSSQNTRLVIFGSVKAKNGLPILSVMDMRPTENHIVIDDMQKVTSSYTKTNNPVEFIRNSDVLYADKKKTTSLLRTIGFQVPIELNKSGFVGSISYSGQNVNIYGEKFTDVFSEGSSDGDEMLSDRDSEGNTLSAEQQEFFKDSKIRDENGNLMKVYHGSPNKFFTFRQGVAEGWGRGIYFTDNKNDASEYGENIVEAYLNITNPFNADTMNYETIGGEKTKAFRDFDMKKWRRWYPEFDTYEEYQEEFGGSGVDMYEIYTEEKEVFNQILRELGYDGIIAKDSNNINGYEIVAFKENQPKLTTNKTPTSDPDIRYSDRVTDEETLDFLNEQLRNGEVTEVYRAMTVDDEQNLYPPMAGYVRKNGKKVINGHPSVIGEWEQSTESIQWESVDEEFLIDNGFKHFASPTKDYPNGRFEKDNTIFYKNKNGEWKAKFHLDKDNGSTVDAAYAPYIHTSLSVLNDQFTSAYTRENLVVVRGYVPNSEVNGVNGKRYQANFADKPVGKTKWHSGVVAAQMPETRTVILSRYFMPIEIVDDAIVAQKTKEMMKGHDIEIPYNVITPRQRKAMEAIGIRIGEARGLKDAPKKADVKYSDREIQPITETEYEALKKNFGVTGNFRVAGYLLPDGKLLDFSGKHWGDTTSRSRQVDHRDAEEVLQRGNNGINSMVDMIGSGSIRLMPETGGINLAVYPNEKQRRVLSLYIKQMLATEGQVIIDYDAVGGDTVHSRVYEKYASSAQILSDIRNYFNGARQSDLMRFRSQFSDRDTDTLYSYRDDLKEAKSTLKTKYKVNPSEVVALADRYYNTYGGGMTKTEFILHFVSIANNLAETFSDGAKGNDAALNSALEELTNIATEIANEPKSDDAMSNDLRDIKRHIRGIKIEIPRYYKGDFDVAGGFDNFRKRHFGKLNLAKGGINVDALYPELTGLFGEAWFPSDIETVPDQLLRIAEVVDTPLSSGYEINYDVDEATEYTQASLYEEISAIIENSKKSQKDIHIDYRDPDSVSNRTLLANALESVAQNDIEKTKLTQYKEKIALIESEQKKLEATRAKIKELSFAKGARDTEAIKKLQFDANQMANRINTYDKQLLSLESTKALKGVLEREKATLRKKLEQKNKESLANYREKAAKTQRELLTRFQESRKKSVEGRHKTALRGDIKKLLKRLNKLFKGGKERNVKEEMKEAVSTALALGDILFSNEISNIDIVNLGVESVTEKESKLLNEYRDILMKKESNSDRISSLRASSDADNKENTYAYISELEAQNRKYDRRISELNSLLSDVFVRERARLNRMPVNTLIDELASEYQKLKSAKDDYIKNAYDPNLYEKLVTLKEKLGGVIARDMSLYQLEEIKKVFTMLEHSIRTANQAFRNGKWEDLQQSASAVMEEIEPLPDVKQEGSSAMSTVRSFLWNELTPYYAFDKIGSKTLMAFFNDLMRGQATAARDSKEAKEFAQATREKYNYSKWKLDEIYEFPLIDGRTFRTTLKHLLSVYAYSKREQADLHMSVGGFFHNDKATFRKEKGILKMVRTDAVGYKVDDLVLAQIKVALGNEKMSYVDEMLGYLTKMGEKGNEVTRILWGIDIFTEKVYFPLKSKDDFLKKSTETAQAVSLKNDGMTKETVPGASNPIVLEAFDDVWSNHVERMSVYHGFVIPIDNLNKIIHYGTWVGTDAMSVSTMLEGKFTSAATDYLEQFINDLNGGAVIKGATNPFMSFFGKFKKTAVGASLSTVVQQPTAIVRAMSEIDAKYFVGKPNLSKLSKQVEELQTYAPIAIIKEIGGFDAGGGSSIARWINSDTLTGIDKVMNTIDDVSMKGAEVADWIGWTTIWEAIKRETKDTTNLQFGSKEFLDKCGERFEEVIMKTQVYDSTLSRSGFMRSKNDGVKMLTSFMGEPTLSINMMYSAVINALRGGKEAKLKAAKTIGYVYVAMILAEALSSAIYALRDDDEDESYMEKYLQSLGGSVVSDIVLAPVTSLPGVKDIVSIFQGWDVERSDMAIFKDIKDAFDGLDSESKSSYRKVEDFAGAIAAAFGLPLKNVLRTGREVYNAGSHMFDDVSGGNAWDAFAEGIKGKSDSNSNSLYKAMISGDQTKITRIKGRYATEQAFESAQKQALRENDSRIQEAAQARYDGNISEYTRIAKEIIREGNFSQDIVVGAINAEMNAIKRGETTVEEPTEDKDEVTSIYSSSDINAAFENGDTNVALEIINDLVQTKVANGKTEKEAKSSVKSSMTSYWKPLYKQAYQVGDMTEMLRIRKILLSSGLYGSSSDVVKTVKDWLKS